jgi:general secretion pathway protein L
MTTLRVRLAAAPAPDRADPWALYDATGACVRRGADPPEAWPAADRVEVVLAASQLRIATITLPPIPPARVAGAAGFALEDQLAGPAAAHHLTVSAQGADGRVRIAVVAHSLLAAIAAPRRGIARIIAEPELAAPIAGWRWCVGDEGGGFVRCADGSAFPVDGLPGEGALPAELALALSQSRRDGTAPPHVRVDAECNDAVLSRWQHETGIAFLRGAAWRWQTAPAAAFASALDLLPDAPTRATAKPQRRLGRLFVPALTLAGAALALHVVASAGEWASLRFDAWRDAREWTSLAAAAGVAPDEASTPQSARTALARRYADLRHAQGLPAPDDALPLLARAAPALTILPEGSVKSATYADGHWTLDLSRADPAIVRDLDGRMRAARVPALIVPSATGTRVRFGGPW